ncbi:MAG: two-component sensor histidine kinase [uncultured bacterium]|nr:MAG: two-component sensor histidine kinase [uncultured bacterium]
MEYNLITNIESCYIDVPGIIYYSHIPTAIISLLVGFFVYFNNKSFQSKILLITSFLFSFWVLSSFVTWVSYDSRFIMFAWSVNGMFYSLIGASMLYFSYVFLDKTDISLIKKILFFLLLIPLFLITPTNLNLSSFDSVNCEAIENNAFVMYYYGLGFLFFIWFIGLIFLRYRKSIQSIKKEIFYFGIGGGFFMLLFLISGYVATILDNFFIESYGIFGMTFFMGMLVYMIVRFKSFNIKLIGAQALIVGQFILIASMLTFASSFMNRTLIGITLFITTVMGWNLVRSVKKEIVLKEELEVSNGELSERKDQLQVMADKLAQSNDQLRVLDNAKSEFISIASHQLRTPLTAIKGFISLLLEGSYGEVQEKHKEVLNKIYTSNERLITLVEDLLNISRIESGRMEFKFDTWDLEKICKEVLDTFVLRAKDHHLYLEYKAPETPLPEVTIDGVKVREVISNLVDNAIKYTLDGHGGITLRLQQFEDKARIIISDTGIGIPATELPYLFAKFSRGKDISRLNTGGTGLGLYVGKNMIESNGGRIWAESEGQDRGSKFIIEIPLVQSEELLSRWG